MELELTTILGLVAGVLTTGAYLPQLIKTWKTKSAEDLSWGMLITACVGIILWLIYGFSISDPPLIIANIVTFLFVFSILCLKIWSTRSRAKKIDAKDDSVVQQLLNDNLI